MTADSTSLDVVRSARSGLYGEGPRRVRSEGDFETVSIPLGDGDALCDALVAAGAGSVIEIGLAYGASALAIGEALAHHEEPTRHLIIDAYQEQFHEAGVEAIVTAGLAERCEILRERSQLVLPRLLTEGVTFDAAFVDGSHIFHNVFVDLHFLRELVRPGGLVILDDCEWPSVATAVRYFELNTGWVDQPFDRETRLRAFRLPDRREEPAFDAFIPFTR